jgi:hypothetical protein
MIHIKHNNSLTQDQAQALQAKEIHLQKRESLSYKLTLLPSQLAQWVWQMAESSGSTAQPTSSAAVAPDLESKKHKT